MSLLAALLIPAALATWPDDISLTSLRDLAGTANYDPEGNRAAYLTVVEELGVAIANRPFAPADSLGVNGFEVEVSNTIAFNSADGEEFGEVGPWGLVHEDETPRGTLWIPRIQVRKGLPGSVDFGAQLGWLATSRQTVLGAYGRWSPLEGYRQAPDVALQWGYAGYVGNDELEAGAMDFSGTISYTLPFGSLLNINTASFTPYAGVGKLWIHARPRLDAETMDDLGVLPVTGFARQTDTAEEREIYTVPSADEANLNPLVLHGGFRLVSRHFQFKAMATWAPQIMPTLNFGMGFIF